IGDVRATGWCSGPGRGGVLIIAGLRGASRRLCFFVLPCYNELVVSPHRLAAQDNTLSRCRSRVRIPLGVPEAIPDWVQSLLENGPSTNWWTARSVIGCGLRLDHAASAIATLAGLSICP